ncbi:MAG: preprotein translocase subunit YajC [Chloroflexi bacterium]|nr:preprotein translocase subunit YajC [Chloroflexota bacterium]
MEEFVLVGVILVLGLGAYWTMVLFPKQRDFQKRQRFARSLSVGDEVITYGGIIGKVIDIQAAQGIAYVEIADGVVIRLVTAALMQPYDPEEIARNAQIGIERETSTNT